MKVYDDRDEDDVDGTADRITVGIGESAVTTGGATITTSGLGSSVGVALYDGEAGVAGLVHVMFPTAPEDTDESPSKYADTGVQALADELLAQGAVTDRLVAKIAGGSDMLDFSEGGPGTGGRNVDQVDRTLAALGIAVTGRDVGGTAGRSLRFDAATGDLFVKTANDRRETV
jgi:chemotaxis protein CheD